MKLGLVLATSLVTVFVGAACSDPPSEPAQGAVDISVFPVTGTCSGRHGSLTIPRAETRVADRLQCDLTKNCRPGEFVAVDGDTDTSVSCSVVQQAGDNYAITAAISQGNARFNLGGTISKTGGKATINHYFGDTQAGLTGECDITIVPNKGIVSGGQVWAKFNCPAFTDPGSPGGQDCAANGAFLFEKCGGG